MYIMIKNICGKRAINMEIIHISAKKIKISLTKNDLEKYSLDTDNLDYANTGTRKAFWSILDDARKDSGFDAAKSRVLIQVFTSPSGGCEMFVTSVNSGGDDSICCVKDPVAKTCERTYSFCSLDDLIGACRFLSGCGYSSDSSAYYCKDRYYIFLSSVESGSSDVGAGISAADIMCEFGDPVSSTENTLIREHAVCFCKSDAVSKLAMI